MEDTGIVFRQADTTTPEQAREAQVASQGRTAPPDPVTSSPLPTPPLSIYSDIRSKPYSADYFDLGSTWQHWNFSKELYAVEDFVKSEIKRFSLTDSVDSYKEIMTSIEDKIGIRENEKIWHKLDRIVTYIKAVDNARKWEARKKKLEEIL